MGVMNTHVKTKRTPKRNNPSVPPAYRGYRHPAKVAAWRLNWTPAEQKLACARVYDELSGGRSRHTATLVEWLRAGDFTGLRLLLRRLEYFAARRGQDESAAFNKLSPNAWEKEIKLRDGAHLDCLIWAIASQRVTDCCRQTWRQILVADFSREEESCDIDWLAVGHLKTEIARLERIREMDAIVQRSLRPHPKDLGELIFARFIQRNGEITQQELAKEFLVDQATVSRKLAMEKQALRDAYEKEYGPVAGPVL